MMKNSTLPKRNLKNSVSSAEWDLRIKLAACYRIIAHYGWEDTIYGHVSARLPESHHYLINPFGVMFNEVTASNLVKVDLQGNLLDKEPIFDINPAGFTIHSAVHEVRKDALCVIHLHTTETVIVATENQGLLPLSQHAMVVLTSLSYHEYEGLAVDHEEKKRLQKDIGNSQFLLLPHHGALTLGSTIGDALLRFYDLQKACEIQVEMQNSNSQFKRIPSALVQSAQEQMRKVHSGKTGGEIAWNAFMRLAYKLDPSFMT